MARPQRVRRQHSPRHGPSGNRCSPRKPLHDLESDAECGETHGQPRGAIAIPGHQIMQGLCRGVCRWFFLHLTGERMQRNHGRPPRLEGRTRAGRIADEVGQSSDQEVGIWPKLLPSWACSRCDPGQPFTAGLATSARPELPDEASASLGPREGERRGGLRHRSFPS
jgi:hypothetical protein